MRTLKEEQKINTTALNLNKFVIYSNKSIYLSI